MPELGDGDHPTGPRWRRRGLLRQGVQHLPLWAQCTNAAAGRTIRVSRYEATLARARQRQADDDWRKDYRATQPKVERKLAHSCAASTAVG